MNLEYTFYYGEEMVEKEPHCQNGRCFPFTVLVYVCRGEYICRIGQETMHVGTGETLVVPPYIYHDVAMTAEGALSWAHISAQSCGVDLLESRSVPHILNGTVSKHIGDCIKRLNHALNGTETAEGDLARDRYISEIYGQLLAVSHSEKPMGKYRTELEKIHSRMLAAPEVHYSLPSLAAELGLSESAFARHFYEAFHISPFQYLSECRIKRAAFLLASGSTVCSTAEALGYYDAYYFSRQFKKTMGISPSEYARTHSVEV